MYNMSAVGIYKIYLNSSGLGWRSARADDEAPYLPVHRITVRYMAHSSWNIRFASEFDKPGEYVVSFYVGKRHNVCHRFILRIPRKLYDKDDH